MIRVATAAPDDRDRLIDFIRAHWAETHIFVDSPEVFTWQHLDPTGRLNMVFAEDTERPDDSVLGVLGFIPMGRFDPSLGDRDLTLAIWKVRDDGAPPGLGLRLLKHLQADLKPRLVAAIGTSQMVRRIYQLLRYEVGEMDHAALFSPELTETRIAGGVPASALASVAGPTSTIQLPPLTADPDPEVRAAVDRRAADVIPTKSFDYIVERYLAHPWYRYDVRQVRRDGRVVAVVVWRAVAAEGSRVLRIVDIVGDVDWLADGAAALQAEVVAHDAEYIDVVHWGIDPELLRAGGFVRVADVPDLVLPNYFAPFEARNITIEMACKVFDDDDRPVRLFRADSDQDRPNKRWELEPPI